MKTHQKSQKLFIFEDGSPEDYEAFIQKTFPLLKHSMLFFRTDIPQSLKQTITALGLSFCIQNGSANLIDSTKSSPTTQDLIIHKVRSGEEIISQGNIIILGNVANGARIKSDKNITIFGDCEGVVEVGGEFLILSQLKSGHITFKDEVLSSDIIKKINSSSCLKIIIKNDDRISLKEIL